jgi:hypothetical protein
MPTIGRARELAPSYFRSTKKGGNMEKASGISVIPTLNAKLHDFH